MKCISGGALGVDDLFAYWNRKAGGECVAMSFTYHNSMNPNRKVLRFSELDEANPLLQQVAKILGRKIEKAHFFTRCLLQRNYWIVKDVPTVIAMTALKEKEIDGGTAWGIEIAKLLNKEIYLFEGERWLKWQYGFGWVQCERPTLPELFAGIGSRYVKESYKVEMRRLFHFE